jgi:S1-C subfamily serine protease
MKKLFAVLLPFFLVSSCTAKFEQWDEVGAEDCCNAVVQVQVHRAEVDILQPYIMPHKTLVYGSGFFINNDGEIVTNAHVVKNALSIWVFLPALPDVILEATIVGSAPHLDLALLRLTDEALNDLKNSMPSGEIPYLQLGDSDAIRRFDDVFALGYPLGQAAVKVTGGMVSGYEPIPFLHDGSVAVQISAPVNPGSSGGPLLDKKRKVIGINTCMYKDAQNVGYAVLVNRLKTVLPNLYNDVLVKEPNLGVAIHRGSTELNLYLKNRIKHGVYVCNVMPDGPFEKAGVKEGDMWFEVDGYLIDYGGKVVIPELEDPISVFDYISRLGMGAQVEIVVYRHGERCRCILDLKNNKPESIKTLHPQLEEIDFEFFAGLVVMPLSIDHIQMLIKNNPRLANFAQLSNNDPALIVTHVVPNSQACQHRTIMVGDTLRAVNGIPVKTLEDLRQAIMAVSNQQYVVFTTADNSPSGSDNVMTVVSCEKIAKEHLAFEQAMYPVTETTKQFMATRGVQR